MSSYDDAHHSPPAPFALVGLRRKDSDAQIENLPMLIDSGADSTILPGNSARDLGLVVEDGRGVEVEGFDGGRKVLPVVQAVVVFDGKRFNGEYLVDETIPIGVLGRNILNQLVVELNGPELRWTTRYPALVETAQAALSGTRDGPHHPAALSGDLGDRKR